MPGQNHLLYLQQQQIKLQCDQRRERATLSACNLFPELEGNEWANHQLLQQHNHQIDQRLCQPVVELEWSAWQEEEEGEESEQWGRKSTGNRWSC